jgi:hypothetical protein
MADNHFKVNRGLSLVPQTTAPSNPANGDIYYDSVLVKFRKYQAGLWSDLDTTGSGGSGDDLGSLKYQLSLHEDFSQALTQSLIIDTSAGKTDATLFDSANKLFRLSYDASKTVSATGTAATVSSAPGFTVKAGDVIVIPGNDSPKRITAVASQTSFTVESPWAATPTAAPCVISQAVYTVDINNYAGDGLAASAATTSTFNEVLVDYSDSTILGDIIPKVGITPHVGYSVSVDGTTYSIGKSRTTNLTDTNQAATAAVAGSNLYVRFYANKTSGTGAVNLLGFNLDWLPNTLQQYGAFAAQAYALLNGTGTPVNCTLDSSTGKTRLTFVGFVYTNGVNLGAPNGQLEVTINGQKVPRFINSTLTPDAYYKEISSTVIELDSDYSALAYDIEVLKRVGVVDTSSTNASRISALESKPIGVNYISAPDAEATSAGWNRYSNTAQATPVTGSGGSPSAAFTFGTTTSLPLRGNTSFLLSKDAANRQGEGLSYDFTIDRADLAKVLTLSFDYELGGTFTAASPGVSSDLQIYLYDVTNGVVIQPAGYLIDGTKRQRATFQTSGSGTSYRLIFHVASTNASAWTFKFDNIKISPEVSLQGVPTSDWIPYTMVIGAITTAPTKGTTVVDQAYWRRVGDSMEIRYEYQQSAAGSAGSGTYRFPLPAGYSIDQSKISVAETNAEIRNCGSGAASGTTYTRALVTATPGTPTAIELQQSDGVGVGSTLFDLGKASARYAFMATVPILNWSSSVAMSSDTDTRIVAARTSITGSLITLPAGGGGATYDFGSTGTMLRDFDTHGGFPGAGVQGATYTCLVPGFYEFSFLGYTTGVPSANFRIDAYILKNGASVFGASTINTQATSSQRMTIPVSALLQLNAGDQVKVQLSMQTAGSISLDTSSFSVKRLSGPAQIAATETVAFRYVAQAVSTLINGSQTTVGFNTKQYDTHGAFNGQLFTAPVSGLYTFSAAAEIAGLTAGTGQVNVYLTKADQTVLAVLWELPIGGTLMMPIGSTDLRLNAGDQVQIQIYQNNGGNRSVSGSSIYTWFCGKRFGN